MSTNFDKTYQGLINTLSLSLNNGIQVLYDALNNNLTLEDNIKATVVNVTLQVDSTGKPIQGGTVTLTFTGQVDGVFVIGATNVNNPTTYPTSAVQVFGQQSGTTYIINNVTGLQANVSYIIRLVILGL
jgi:hypothetical protein